MRKAMKTSLRAATVAVLAASVATAAWAAVRPWDLRGEGSAAFGATNTASGKIKGRGLGAGNYTAAIGVGGAVFTAPGGQTCVAADGVLNFVRPNSDTLVLDTAGLLCDVGLAASGTVLVPNEVYSGAASADGAASTGNRFSGAQAAGQIQINFSGSGDSIVAGTGVLQ